MNSGLRLALVVGALSSPTGVPAQHIDPATAVAESAHVARTAYRRAAEALARKDLPTARREIVRAAEAWPTQQVYVYNAAALSARLGDSTLALAWLDRYANLGFGRDPGADSSFASLAGVAAFKQTVARIRQNAAPLVHSAVAFSLADSTFHPEGIAYDPLTRRWFLGSIRQRRIVAVDSNGSEHAFVEAGADGQLASVFGLAVDARRRLLWVATSAMARMDGWVAADRGRAGVAAFDLENGRLVRQAWLPHDTLEHVLGDVAIAPNGDVYASDSESPALYVLRIGAAAIERLLVHPVLHSPQGMAVTPDGRTLFVADYSHGIVRVDLTTRRVESLVVPAGISALGIDGLYLHHKTLLVVQNGVVPARIMRYCLDAPGRRVVGAELLDRNLDAADEPSLGVVVDGRSANASAADGGSDALYYVATSAWEKYDDDGRRIAGTRLRAPTVLRLPVSRRASCASGG